MAVVGSPGAGYIWGIVGYRTQTIRDSAGKYAGTRTTSRYGWKVDPNYVATPTAPVSNADTVATNPAGQPVVPDQVTPTGEVANTKERQGRQSTIRNLRRNNTQTTGLLM